MKIKGKKVQIMTIIWSLIMFISVLVEIVAYGNDTVIKVVNPLGVFATSKSMALVSLFYMMTAILFAVFSIVYRKNIKMMLIPISCPLIMSIVVAFYQGFRFGNWTVFEANSFRELSYLLILIIFALVVFEKYNNKLILTIVSAALIVLALAYFLASLRPFVVGTTIYFSKLIFFISYNVIVLTYSIGMKKED